jgi:hypothetical protein
VEATSNTNRKKPQKYIPPAMRKSGNSSPPGEPNTRRSPSTTLNSLHLESSNGNSLQFREGINGNSLSKPNRNHRNTTLPELVNPNGRCPGSSWEGRRKGGNRAPMVEPEGTTSWRTKPETQREVPPPPPPLLVCPEILGVIQAEEENEDKEERPTDDKPRLDPYTQVFETLLPLRWPHLDVSTLEVPDHPPYVDERGNSKFFKPAGRTRSRFWEFFNSDAYKKRMAEIDDMHIKIL